MRGSDLVVTACGATLASVSGGIKEPKVKMATGRPKGAALTIVGQTKLKGLNLNKRSKKCRTKCEQRKSERETKDEQDEEICEICKLFTPPKDLNPQKDVQWTGCAACNTWFQFFCLQDAGDSAGCEHL